jgi:GTP-binding protein
MKTFAQAEFLAAAGRPADMPPPGPPELAFAGRSNVGKSSAINALLARKRLAYTSKTPGRTQTINFFTLAGGERLVDLPGYGYAKVPRPLRAQWEALVGGYLEADRALAGVVVVMDARHPLTPLDHQLLAWLGDGRDVRVLLLLSKADKLSRVEQAESLRVALASGREAQLFSSLSKQGVEECRRLLEQWLAAAGRNKKPPVKGM